MAKRLMTKVGCGGPAHYKMRSQRSKHGGIWVCGGERCQMRAWAFFNDTMGGALLIDPRIARRTKSCGESV